MAIVNFPDTLCSMKVRKKFAVGTGATPHPNACVYQQKQTKEGKRTSKMAYVIPTNPRTELQQANRAKFANAVSAWQVLDESTKAKYHRRATSLHMSGYNLFISEYLNTH